MSEPFFFTWRAQQGARGIEITGGEGAWFTVASGERWLDLGSLIYQANLGHGRRDVVEAICAQARRLCLTMPVAVYPEKRRLAERLLALAPRGFSKVFYTLGGSDANENALKIARLVTGRFKALARYRSYHGATMGAVTLSGDWRRPPVEPGLPGIIHVDDRDATDAEAFVRALEFEGPSTVAAVFVESIVGGNGVHRPPPGYLRQLRHACDRHGVLLVVDEVLAGFGRTGRTFGFEHEPGLVPDLITCGKALTGGYGVLGAVLVHERVAAHFETRPLVAGLTHYAHPLGVAAALAALDVLERERLVERAAGLEPVLASGLQTVVDACPAVARRARAVGLLGAVDVDLDASGWDRLEAALVRRRIHVHLQRKVGAIVVAPPLVIAEPELRHGLGLLAEALREVAS